MGETAPVIEASWDGESFRPTTPYQQRLADDYFVVGERYRITELHDRSMNAHRRSFAALHEAWQNLPPELATRFPTAEHLRKTALCRSGFADHTEIVCASKEEAMKVVTYARGRDEYAVIAVTENVISIWTAHSQSMRSMGKQQFHESVDAVDHFCATLLGLGVEELRANAGRSA